MFILGCLLTLLFVPYISSQEVALEKTDTGYQIVIDGALFAQYKTNFNGTPIVWPIIGPSGQRMTRNYPMSDDFQDEKKDHPHHRSLWFTHDEVNGNRHWMSSVIEHQKFLKAESDGKKAVIETKNNWLDQKTNETVCSDIRNLTFGAIQNVRYLDFNITITAEQETVTFADTKEGTFGIRVPSSMDVDAKKNDPKLGGTITNAEGILNDEAWGKRSSWVDYSGPVEGKTAGITIMNHPDSFRFPTYWHVRTYGLFAANPFGVHEFEKNPELSGELVLKKGESLTLKYRVLFHDGDADSLDIPKLFEAYCELSR